LPLILNLFARGAPDVSGFEIGLAVRWRLVELHGGTITAHTVGVCRATEFVVSLPIATGV
jgi:signal transduction histidine kinase